MQRKKQRAAEFITSTTRLHTLKPQIGQIGNAARRCGMAEQKAAIFSLYISNILAEGGFPKMPEVIKHFRGKIPERQIRAFFYSVSIKY